MQLIIRTLTLIIIIVNLFKFNYYFNLLLQIILLESILNSLHQNIELNNLVLLIENCIEISTYSNISLCSLSASRLAATLINKYIKGTFMII